MAIESAQDEKGLLAPSYVLVKHSIAIIQNFKRIGVWGVGYGVLLAAASYILGDIRACLFAQRSVMAVNL